MRGFFFCLGYVVFSLALLAQQVVQKVFYTSPLKKNIHSELVFKSVFASINLQSTTNENPYTIKGNVDEKKFDVVFRQSETEFKKTHSLNVKNISGSKLDASPFQIFSNKDEENLSDWLLFVSDKYEQKMEFHLGNGSLDMNLSNIPTRTIKINSIKASNNLYYQLGQPNKLVLDTLYIKNELGNVNVKNFSLANCSYLISELGFGKMTFHLGGISKVPAKYKFKIGTGELVFKVPYKEMPVKLIVNGSSLAKVEIPKDFVKIDKKTYLSPSYTDNSLNKLIVEFDVSLGKVVVQ